MTRGIGEVEVIQGFVPQSLIPLAELVTRLGDVSTLVAVTVLAVLLFDRDRGLYLFGVVVGGFALLAGLKAILGLPRPAAELRLIETATTGFPSGHALGATLVYGGVALLLRVGSRRLRVAVLGIAVGAIALSRLVLGVHYLIDVVAGVVIALGYLDGIDRLTRRDPGRAFAAAAVLGVLAFVAGVAFGPTARAICTGGLCVDRDAAAVTAAALGALGAWVALNRLNRNPALAVKVLTPGGVVLGGTLLWIDSAPIYGLVGTAVGAAALVVLVERGTVQRWSLRPNH